MIMRPYVDLHNQMVNTRGGAGSSNNQQNNNVNGLPNPPPVSLEQLMVMQAQLLNTVNNAVQALADAQARPPPA